MSHGFTGHAWRRPLVVAALATVAMSAPFAHADDAAGLAAAGSSALAKGSADTTLALDLRLRTELRAVMTELIEAGAFGDRKPEQIALAVDSPAQRVSDLGVLVDSSRDDRNGLHVLAVTPGGSAERMGMRAGDVLIAMNGVPFAGDGRTAAAGLRRNIDGLPDGSALAFTSKCVAQWASSLSWRSFLSGMSWLAVATRQTWPPSSSARKSSSVSSTLNPCAAPCSAWLSPVSG